MKDLLTYITQNITDNDTIEVIEDKDGDTFVYTIRAPQSVMGLLIGKEGRTIKAIRSLARARAIVEQIGVTVKLEEISN